MPAMLVALVAWLSLQTEAGRLWDQGQREAAVAGLVGELAQRPDDRTLRLQVARAELAIHRNQAALEHLAPLGAEVDALRGTALFRLGRFEDALARLCGDDAEQCLMRIDALEALARFDDAEREIARLARLAGELDPRVSTARGRSLARRGEWAPAVEQFRASLARDPCDAAALFGLGQALARSGEREEGLRVLAEHRRITPLLDSLDFALRAVDLAPQHGPNHAAVGDAERALGRLDRAEAAYARAAVLAQGEDLVPIALRHARLLAEDRRQLGLAVDLLAAAADRHADARLHVRAGDLLAQLQRTSEALARYESAQRLRPNDAEIARRIAELRAREQ